MWASGGLGSKRVPFPSLSLKYVRALYLGFGALVARAQLACRLDLKRNTRLTVVRRLPKKR